MKKSLSLFLCVVILLSALSLTAFAENKVTLYASDGRTITVYESEVSAYKAVGWYTAPLVKLYSESGDTIKVPEDEVSAYRAVGWHTTQPKINAVTPLPVKFTSGTGNSAELVKFEITKLEYLKDTSKIRLHGIQEFDNEVGVMFFTMYVYDSNGNKVNTINMYHDNFYVDISDQAAYLTIQTSDSYTSATGKYTYKKQIDIYAADGRKAVIYDLQLPVYEAVGWEGPVTLYALDGRTITVAPNEVDSYKAVGWYSYNGYTYAKFKNSFNSYYNSGDYNNAMNLAEDNLTFFKGTSYESYVKELKYKAMDAWRSSISCPLAITGYKTGSYYGTPTATIYYRNVSYKKIVAFKLKFTCYNVFGEVEKTYYDYYYSDDENLESGASNDGYWKLYGADSVDKLYNIRVTEVVYSDGTKWYR